MHAEIHCLVDYSLLCQGIIPIETFSLSIIYVVNFVWYCLEWSFSFRLGLVDALVCIWWNAKYTQPKTCQGDNLRINDPQDLPPLVKVSVFRLFEIKDGLMQQVEATFAYSQFDMWEQVSFHGEGGCPWWVSPILLLCMMFSAYS